MKFFKLSLALAMAAFLASCAEPRFDKICEEGDEVRPCTARESAMIDDMQTIIMTVRNYEYTFPTEAQWIGRQKTTNGSYRVFFFGESHPEIIGRMQTLGALNAALKRDDVLLLEGGDWQGAHFRECGLHLVFQIYWMWQFEKLGKSYPDSFGWKKIAEFVKMFHATKRSYDLSGLSIADLRCGYWDDRAAIEICQKDLSKVPKYLVTRNSAMVDAIKAGLNNYSRVFINAGFAHLPSGDRLLFIRRNAEYFKKAGVPRKMSDFYRLVDTEQKKPHASRLVVVDQDHGSTKVIYDYLKKEKINFSEAIHGRMAGGGLLSPGPDDVD